jgi:hypothetical protein
MTQNNETNSPEIWFIAIFVIFFLLYNHKSDIDNFKNFISNINIWIYPIIFLIFITLGFLSYIISNSIKKSYLKINHKITQHKNKVRLLKNETREIEKLLDKDFIIDKTTLTKDIETFRNKISYCNYNELAHFKPELKKRLAKAREFFEQTRKKQFLDELHDEIQRKKYQIEDLNKEIYAKQLYEKDKNEIILWELKAEDNPVFYKENLSKEQINALIENGYHSVCEYDIIKKKPMNVLVKTKLNHSPTHAFLVWNVTKVLDKINGIKNIREFLTKEADVVFNFKNKLYALEIETGSLLYKEKQLKEKVNHLNKNYPKRWIFIVSNKNLLSKYRKFGLATQRKGVLEKLEKMLKISHPI